MSYTVGNGNITFPDGSVWSTAGASYNAGTAQNGYLKFPSGLIYQWGTATTSSSNSPNSTFNFPIAFPNSVLGVFIDEGYTVGWMGNPPAATIYTVFTPVFGSYVNIGGQSMNGTYCTYSTGLGYRLIAIGY